MSLVKMSELLKTAETKCIGRGAFNVGNMEMVRGVVRAAEERNTPVIMQIAEGRLSHSPLELMAPMMVEAARNASVDIAVHLDHGKSIEVIKKALDYGFTSVMFDGSGMDFQQNLERTREIAKLAAEYGADTEGELGVVGGSEDGGKGEKIRYTDPHEAARFCKETKIDALAVAIGNAHGNYTLEPKLAFGVLKEIHDKIDKPLVLHGGTGISDQDYKKAISLGIRKLNIATANLDGMAAGAKEYVRNTENVNFFGLNQAMTESVYRIVKRYIDVFHVERR